MERVVGIFFFFFWSVCYYLQETPKRASTFSAIDGEISISDIPGKEAGSDLHMKVGRGGIFYVTVEGGTAGDGVPHYVWRWRASFSSEGLWPTEVAV